MLDVRRLRVLSEVADRRSFSEAARALTLTQSAVSQHIAALEREVGPTVIERGTRPLELTRRGTRCPPRDGHLRAARRRRAGARRDRGPAARAAAVRELPDGAGHAGAARVRAVPPGPPGGAAHRGRRPPAAARAAAGGRRARPRAHLRARGAAGDRRTTWIGRRSSRTRSRRSCPRATAWRGDARGSGWRTSPTSRGSAARPGAGSGSSATPARGPASSRRSASRPTTTSPSRRSSPPGWASPSSPGLPSRTSGPA